MSLLLELRPSSLTEAKLGDLFRQVAGIITNRTGLNISVQIEEQEPVPPEVHFALYRVVQEALNNVVLHASASQVEVYFQQPFGPALTSRFRMMDWALTRLKQVSVIWVSALCKTASKISAERSKSSARKEREPSSRSPGQRQAMKHLVQSTR